MQTNLLHTQHVSVKIGSKIICRDLNLDINPGDVWAILGSNGSGKTTLLHALAGFFPLAYGDIFLGENKLTQLSIKTIAQSIGILFQDFNLTFPQTVWEYCRAGRYPHLAYFKKDSAKDQQIVMHALQKMELDKLTHRPVAQLSGGEKRRLAIAALLAQTPSIYLLDEPTNHLDMRHQMSVLNHFRDLAATQSAAIILSLHDVNLAQQFCNHFLFLFPDGSTLQGSQQTLLTCENLTRLYQHPVKMTNGAPSFWYPE